jgi:hypothetical protein
MQDQLVHRDPKHFARYTRLTGHRFEALFWANAGLRR